jgi:hypothetical protein
VSDRAQQAGPTFRTDGERVGRLADPSDQRLEEPLLSLDRLVNLTGLSYHSLWREVRAGRMRASKRCNRWMVRRDWYEQWLEAGVPDPNPPPAGNSPATNRGSLRSKSRRRPLADSGPGSVADLTAIEGDLA